VAHESLTQETIDKSFLFKSLDPKGREMLLQASTLVKFQNGDVIVREGDPGDAFYLIKTGEVQVTTQKGGKEIVLANLAPGAFFGEVSIITGEPRTATVSAITDGEAVRFDKAQVSKVLKTYPRVAEILKKIVARRTEDTIKKVTEGGNEL